MVYPHPWYYLALEQVNFNVTGFVAELGIAGFTIGFALQDISKNFVSGMLILLPPALKSVNSVELSNFRGTVTEITLRDTVIKTWDGEVVILPNASVYANPIKNFSGLTDRRQTLRVGIGYEDDLEISRQKILQSVQAVDVTTMTPSPRFLQVHLARGDQAQWSPSGWTRPKTTRCRCCRKSSRRSKKALRMGKFTSHAAYSLSSWRLPGSQSHSLYI